MTVLMAVAPNSLDPAVGYTPQALEPDWLVYTPLLTYDHSDGVPGTDVIPGLAGDLPVISDGGRTYSLALRPGLVYSNGQPVKASDFAWAVERAIRLRWAGARQLITSRIVGASAFAAGRARSISGIAADDTTGQISIQLTAPWGAFENVLALPATAPVPSGTPFRNEQREPPPGIGPYEFAGVVPGHSFSLVRNPHWRHGLIPFVPIGHIDIAVKITGNPRSNALSVLNNTADVFDPADRVPPSLVPRILREAPGRYSKQAINGTYVIFMNVTRRPFSSRLARIAVQTALDDNTLREIGADDLQEGCFLLPPSMYGHPHGQCPRGNIENGGNLAAARALVARSGTAGAQVIVWGEASPPFSGWMTYYTAMLNRIGFRARLKLVPAAKYYPTVGTLELHPQTGFGEFGAALPTPVDLYQHMTGPAIRPQGNQNWGEISDPLVDRQVRVLNSVPSGNLASVAEFWHDLEGYVADQAYVAVFGYQLAPQFVSNRLNYSRITFSPVAGLDWTSFHLK